MQRRMIIDFRLFRRFGLLLIACVLCLMFWTTRIEYIQQLDYDELSIETNDKDFCNGELFAYRHISIVNSQRIVQKGKAFDCSKLKYLKKFNLTRENEIWNVESNYPKDLIFVSAADTSYFPSVKTAFATVRKHFGNQNKFILYDLGGLNETHSSEISQMCNVELRKFDFNQLPKNVQGRQIFSWKVFILAEVFNEATNIIYLDSSIFFESGNFDIFFDMMSHGFRLIPFQMSGYTGHSVQFATNKEMYKYLPFDLSLKNSEPMLEANLLLLHKSETTRQLLKWAVLCASTRDCIEPPGSELFCDIVRKDEHSVCHRQDQSIFSILTYNLEKQYHRYGFPTILANDKRHPKTKQRHITVRGQQPFGISSFSC